METSQHGFVHVPCLGGISIHLDYFHCNGQNNRANIVSICRQRRHIVTDKDPVDATKDMIAECAHP
ncbi:MAG TPA: hypothetical protein VH500_24550 [Nitrososphaeraceae archaeon]